MLTKNDFSQIRTIVKSEVKSETDPLRKGMTSLQGEVRDLQGEVKEGLSGLRSDVKVLRRDVTKIRRDISTIVNFFDREYLELRARVEKIERHLGLAAV